MSTTTENQIPTSRPEQIERFGEELDAIRQRVLADRGERDANYIRRVIRAQRGLEVAGRGLLWAGVFPPAWIAGTAALSLSKILDNMEIGHNVMHGQYDWMNDPALAGKKFEWDNACPADQWRHSHNYMHHTHTNIVGKDRDIGYGVLRMSEDQPWSPYYLGNPLYATLLALLFQYGVAVHDLEVERSPAGKANLGEKRKMAKGDLAEGPPPDPEGLRDLPGAVRARSSSSPWPATRPRTWSATSGRSRSSSAATSRKAPTSSPRRRPRTRAAASGTTASCSARPTSSGGRPFHILVRQPQLPDRAPPVPGPAGQPLRGDLRRGARDLRALRHPLQHRPARQAVRQRRQEDLPPGAAGP